MAKKRSSQKKSKPIKTNKKLIVAVALIAVVTIAILLQQQPAQQTQQPYIPVGQEKNYQTASTGSGCKTNQGCFQVSCKSNPTVVNCINSTAQEVYYVNCNGYTDVKVVTPQDFTKCACVQGTCRMIA